MKVLVLDFDGTMTDAEEEGAPFRRGYLEDVATLVDRPYEEVDARAREIEAEVAEDPQSYGWRFGGRIVAPATVDPYLRVMPVARRLLNEAGVFDSAEEQARLLDGVLYKYNYKKTRIAFREGASEVLAGLEGTATWVVTNSHTVPVQEKLRTLGADWLIDRVHGRARKYIVDDGFDAVPEALELPGLSRPVLLRRANYYRVLTELLDSVGADWEDLTVVGDIFELDLCLPLAMGAKVGLAVNEHTPAYEKAFLEAHPRGGLLDGLDEIPAFAFGA